MIQEPSEIVSKGLKVIKKENVPKEIFSKKDKKSYDWHYGFDNKSHYVINEKNKKVIACLNIIFIQKYDSTYIYYIDTIEVIKKFRNKGIGSYLMKNVLKDLSTKHNEFSLFLLVAKCKQKRLRFFKKLGFVPIRLRQTRKGIHCIMTYPYSKDSGSYCKKLFEFFHWREKKREFISSDCKYAFNPNPTGLYWCSEKKIYVTGLEKKNCPHYEKTKEIYFEEKFLNKKK